MTFRTRTPISDYYQHKEKLKKKEQARAESNTFKAVSNNEQRPSRLQ